MEKLPRLLLAKHWIVSGKPSQPCKVNVVRDSFSLMLELEKDFEESGPNHLTSLGGLESAVKILDWQED